MFTGIIEEVGTVSRVQHSGNASFIEIQAKKVLEDVHLGDSIAVNGVCLTVTHFGGGVFRADVMNETLSRSSLGSLTNGSPVNLERAMAANGRFGGHIVSGHIDGTGIITDIKNDGIAVWYTVSAAPELLRYIVEKGSIAIDGISLTVAKVTDTSFSVSIIPHTAAQTILSTKKTGDTVNLENDIIAKYAEKLMKPAETPKTGGITMDFLAKNGF
ncbi:riboflavin synthase [Ruminococcus flavefaciens]|jgi:riboflavin synthase|uniref:Riboflavin synthase n=1 Tax=Ruminococcus flavefaciens TaxID=1265 RepID=A0A1K1LJY2_RUMFL|nr:riboflavin synthase [Ruminococcus flavefaciens]SFW11187.1 riboflavin synthase alpha chain [Ruminococcus flavefaciens]